MTATRTAILCLACSFADGLRLLGVSPKSNAETYVPSDSTGKLVLCTQVQNEVPYLFEWIAFHRALGVDQFDIYNHMSSDGVERLPELYKAAGKPYVNVIEANPNWHKPRDSMLERGHAQEFRQNVNVGPQPGSFNDCLNRHRNASWVGFTDVDEFMSLQPNLNRPLCEGQQLKCWLTEQMQLGYSQVSFSALRFSSNKQVWRHGNPLEQQESFKRGYPSIMLETASFVKNQTVDCKALGEARKLSRTSGGLSLSQDPCGSSAVPTITGSHIFRGPSEGIEGENYEDNLKKHPNCITDPAKKHEGGYRKPICGHGQGKSFVQPQKCDTYRVHSCVDHIKTFKVPVTDARLNHYYTRSAEDACQHSKQWPYNDDPVVVYTIADDGFFKEIEDQSAVNAVPQTQLQKDMASVMCQK